MFTEKLPVPPLLAAWWLPLVVGLEPVPQQMPRSVTMAPPSSVTLPEQVAMAPCGGAPPAADDRTGSFALFLRFVNKEKLLEKHDEAHRLSVVAAVVIARDEVAVVEAHVARAATIAVRRRPVVAVRTDIVDRSTVTEASGGQEDRTVLLQGGPVRGGDGIRCFSD